MHRVKRRRPSLKYDQIQLEKSSEILTESSTQKKSLDVQSHAIGDGHVQKQDRIVLQSKPDKDHEKSHSESDVSDTSMSEIKRSKIGRISLEKELVAAVLKLSNTAPDSTSNDSSVMIDFRKSINSSTELDSTDSSASLGSDLCSHGIASSVSKEYSRITSNTSAQHPTKSELDSSNYKATQHEHPEQNPGVLGFLPTVISSAAISSDQNDCANELHGAHASLTEISSNGPTTLSPSSEESRLFSSVGGSLRANSKLDQERKNAPEIIIGSISNEEKPGSSKSFQPQTNRDHRTEQSSSDVGREQSDSVSNFHSCPYITINGIKKGVAPPPPPYIYA